MKLESSLSAEEMIERIKKATVAENLFRNIGLPSGSIISLFRGSTFRLREKKSYANSFAPLFYGSVRPVGPGSEIEGHFRMLPFAKIFMFSWFGMLALMGLIMIFHSFWHGTTTGLVSTFVAILPMGIFGACLVKFGQLFGRKEEQRMTLLLQTLASSALEKPSRIATMAHPAPQQKMIGVVFFFGALGIISLVLAALGDSSIQTSSETSFSSTGQASRSHTVVTHFHNDLDRTLAIAIGIFLCGMAYGTLKRRRIVWKLGFALIALNALSFVESASFGLPGTTAVQPPILVTWGIMPLGAIAVSTFWGIWWSRKKDYFTN